MLLIKIKLMPVSPQSDLKKISEEVKKIVESYNQRVLKQEIEPIAFGLNALIIIVDWPDDKGADEIEEKLKTIEEVKSAEIIDVRRAIG